MAVSNLAELRRTLRQPDASDTSYRQSGLVSAVRETRDSILSQLSDFGRAEVVDRQGNRFIIERRNG